ncbi:MAG: VOC family protein [Dehalococcoidia bacterium]|nr:VOC family protein [Dehalococcoidia bacterium]
MIISHNHSSFTVSDLNRSVAFYRDVIGFKVDVTLETESAAIKQITGFPDAHLKIAHLLLGSFRLELIQYLAPKGRPVDPSTCNVGTAHIAFYADNVDSTYRELQAKGVRFKGAPVAAAAGRPRVAYFLDPDGITLELSQSPG